MNNVKGHVKCDLDRLVDCFPEIFYFHAVVRELTIEA